MVNATYAWRALLRLIRFLHSDEVFGDSPDGERRPPDGERRLPDGERRLPDGPVAVRFDRVRFSSDAYWMTQRELDESSELREVSFAAGPGTVTALVGPDGAAKTAVVELTAGLYRPDSGRVT